SRQKMMDELPGVLRSKRTAARALSSLVAKDLIHRIEVDQKTYTTITPKGAQWMKAPTPWMSGGGAKSGTGGAKVDTRGGDNVGTRGMTKVTHNHINQLSVKPIDQEHVPSCDGTNDPSPKQLDVPARLPNGRWQYPEWFESLWSIYPKRAGGNSKKAAHKALNAR